MTETGKMIRLIRHELRLEWKNKQAFTSLVVYTLASLFIVYLAFSNQMPVVAWNALFWIITLFAATNAVARSFLQESRGLQFYYYTLLNARTVIFAKTIYNSLLLLGLSALNLLFYSVLFPSPLKDPAQFLLILLLGCTGLAAVLTLVSGIVSRASGNAALVAILGFPLLLPLLITLIRFSTNAIEGFPLSYSNDYLLILVSLDLMIFSLSFLLFPYLWRE
jgi:heme exporter protein B